MIKIRLRKIGMGILLFGMTVCCYTAAPVKAAETDVPINSTTFPDAAFLEYVGRFDTSGDGSLSEDERNAVKEIVVNVNNSSQTKIGSLAGIEYFPNLTVLECDKNQLASLDVSKNTELTTLKCRYNQLTNLDVTKNTKLQKLWFYDNQISSIDLSKNTELLDLACGKNSLTSLDVSHNTKLEGLHAYYNTQLTTLDLSNMTNLTTLECYGSSTLTSLNISGDTALKELKCYECNLTSLDTSDSPELTKLVCGQNWIAELNLSQNTQLQELFCANNNLTTLDISNNPDITQLDCSSNRLATLKLGDNIKLDYLSCKNNRLTSLDVSDNTALQALYISENSITSLDMSKNPDLETLVCQKNQLTNLDVSANTKLFYLDCQNNQLTRLDVSKNPDLSTLNCVDNAIDGLDISQNSELSSFDFSGNPIKVLKVTEKYSDRNLETSIMLYDTVEVDMGQISGWDANSISNITGAKLADNVLTVDSMAEEVTYTYDCGYNCIMNVRLYTRWNEYQITYELNGGTNAAENPASYYPLPTATALQDPVKEGYTFEGWYEDVAFTSRITEIPKGHVGNMTLYAKWSEAAKPSPSPAVPSPTPTTPVVPSPTPTTPAAPSPTPTTPAAPSPAVTPTATPAQSTTPAPAQQPTAKPTQQPTVVPAENGKEGTILKDGQGATFKVTNADSENPEVQYEAPAKNAKGKVKVPAFVKVNGVTYRVTSVSGKAFKGNDKITKIVIGKNITKIGKKAFSKCKKLKLLVIKSRKLKAKNVAKNAFKGITKKTVVKVPKSKIKAYRKLLRKKGLSSKVKAIKRIYSSQEV